ncbi:MAG: hypothetical protein K2G58_02180, partial [Alistipes sp.]|nr:hypothetical protein [Alistipes sp.]
QPDAGGTKTQTDGKVELSVLDRKCALINFSVTRKAENVSKVVINEVTLSKIAHSPVEEAILCKALSIGKNDCDYKFPKETFIKGKEAYQYSVIDELLPKSNAPFDLKMKVTFNDAPDPTELTATIPSMSFSAGLKYNFDLVLRGGSVVLLLQITPWNTPADWDNTGIGGYPETSIEVGKWEIEWNWSTDLGGYPILVPSIYDWIPNSDWSTSLGA